MILKRFSFVGALALGSFIFLSSASATPVSGQLNFTGQANVTGTTATFYNNAGTVGMYTLAGPNTGDFSTTTGGSTLMALPSPGPVTGPVVPPIVGFLTANTAAGVIAFDLTDIMPGNFDSSPFVLTPLSSTSTLVSLVLNGWAYLGTSGTNYSSATSAQITFSTQVNMSEAALIAAAAAPGGVTESFSATLNAVTSTVPEPASLLLMGAGLLGAGLIARRKARG